MDAEIIGFASGKGGTGKSTVAVMLGGAMAELGKKVLLLELNSGLRSVDILSATAGQTVYDIEDVLSGRCEPGKAVVESPLYPGLSVMAAPYKAGKLTTRALRVLCKKMRPYFDFVFIDTAAGLGYLMDASATVADRMVLVLTPDPLALRDGRLIADDVMDKLKETRLILNRVDKKQVLSGGILRDLDEAIDMVGVRLLGVIPENPTIAYAGATSTTIQPDTIEAEIFEAIALRLLGEDIPLVLR